MWAIFILLIFVPTVTSRSVVACGSDCLNGGTCDITTGTCNCPEGFEGDACETEICGDDIETDPHPKPPAPPRPHPHIPRHPHHFKNKFAGFGHPKNKFMKYPNKMVHKFKKKGHQLHGRNSKVLKALTKFRG